MVKYKLNLHKKFQVVNEIGLDASDAKVKEFCENLFNSGQVNKFFLMVYCIGQSRIIYINVPYNL